MPTIEQSIRLAGWFLRRRDLLARGHTDPQIRGALAAKRVFRVRHGWYSVPDAPESAIRAVRVGGRLTGVDALRSYGLRVPYRETVSIAVPRAACRLRRPGDRRERLYERGAEHPAERVPCERRRGFSLDGTLRIHWVDERRRTPDDEPDPHGGTVWRVSIDDALLVILREEPRDIAVACCSAVMRFLGFSWRRLDQVFARAPQSVQCWRRLVSKLDESHGETFARLWMLDAGLAFAQQVHVAGEGRLDFGFGGGVYLEVDGAQHDPAWTGEGPSSWESDVSRMITVAIDGGSVIHASYRMLYTRWAEVLAAIERLVADARVLAAYRRRHPYRPRAHRKRRKNAAETAL